MTDNLKYSALLLVLGVLICSCANNTPTEKGFLPNDLDELRKSPEYVNLSKYVAEDPEDAYIPEKTPEESDSEDDLAITHIKYDRPVNGYTVTVDLYDGNFDGTKELLVKEPLAGTRGTNLYHVYELDGTERTDEPLDAICDLTTFNASEKSITQEEYYGVILGSDYLKYRRQPDGSFALTDSTHVDY